MENSEVEIWEAVVGFEGYYEISSLGNVRSLDHFIKMQSSYQKLTLFKGKTLGKYINRYGYVIVGLYKDRKAKSCKVHRLVCEAFHPNPENKSGINHINGIKTDNRAVNVEWATPKENNQHAVKTGLKPIVYGEKTSQAKLNNTQVLEIRSKYATGNYNQRKLAKEYEVKQPTISDIIRGKCWNH